MITVLATREGLIGGKTSTGWRVNAHVPFVALPSTAALRQWVTLHNPANGRSCRALVLDVGPWNVNDDAYVFQPSTLEDHVEGVVYQPIRPQAETGTDTTGRPTNHAGIDLGEAVWQALGMTGNSEVSWEFL